MAYTLALNSMTIKLVSHIYSEQEAKKTKSVDKAKKTKDSNEIASETVGNIENTNKIVGKLDSVKIAMLQQACGVIPISIDQAMQKIPFNHPNGMKFDLVVDSSLATNDYYVLGVNIDQAITEKSLKNVIQKL